MFGMFQSSSTASGSCFWQACSAFSPSSASTISKSRPSRMRRATFRMTLESSTTRHVFILGLQLHQIPRGMFPFQLRSSCRHQVRHDFENAIDVEDDHELAVETVNTAGELGHAGVEIDGVFLAAIIAEFQDFADLVDQQAVGFAAQ